MMDDPRLSFIYDEIPFWRLAAILLLILLIFSLVCAVISARSNFFWDSWHSTPAAIHATLSPDYQLHKESSFRPLQTSLLQEIQNNP
jgi:hypothetical protein